MDREEACLTVKDAIDALAFDGEPIKYGPYGSGHINDTFLVVTKTEDGREKRYILQHMNKDIFKNPVELMENVANVTEFLSKKILANGGDPERETLNIVKTKDGANFFVDKNGEYWRGYIFIEDSFSYDMAETPEDFYSSALAFGKFQQLLADYPADTLHETIPQFHDTVKRFNDFKKAVEADAMGRAKDCQKEIDFVMEREADTAVLMNLLKEGKLPLKVTHNDTKLNNVLIDKETGKGLCVIDLDTVMPGLSVNDYGDSIRFGASTALEDEKDLSKVSCDMGLFEIYTKGFLEACGNELTEMEIDMLPMGAKTMTLECGMRFLTDYLEGDHYFKTHREGHNLDRARTQFKLVHDMESKWAVMQEIVAKYKK